METSIETLIREFVEFLLNTIFDDKEYSTKELIELLCLKHRPTFRDNYLLPALERGLIEMTVPDKPNRRYIWRFCRQPSRWVGPAVG